MKLVKIMTEIILTIIGPPKAAKTYIKARGASGIILEQNSKIRKK